MLSSGNVTGGGLAPADLTTVGSTIYFAGNDGVHGTQLWASTGTAAGTAMVADINGTSTADVTNLINMNGTPYFAAYTAKYGYQVWQSNGTSSGTVMDTDLSTGSSNTPTNFVAMGTTLCFTAPGATMWLWQASKITPTITWAAPAGITYGTALSATQLDATASVPGTFAYSPAAGTVLKAGSGQALSVSFTPTDTTDYTGASATTTIDVARATPTITWPSPAGIVYGAALSATQLDASATVPGTFTYSPTAGTVPKAGSDTLSVTFTPTDTTDYTTATDSVTLVVARATPTITWASPAGIVYGTVLSATQLDASATVPGTFAYSPATGAVLGAGSGQTLSVTFTPNDTTDYAAATGTTTIDVARATPTITWASPAGIVYGTALSATQLDASATVPGTFAYSPATGAVLGAGNGQTLSVTFTPKDTTDYTGASASTAIDVARATPTITWAAPAGIAYGTALSATQLDASASVPGTFTYSPPAGTVLGAGNGQVLSVAFTPNDITDYTRATGSTVIDVAQATSKVTPTITWAAPAGIVYGTALSATQLDASAGVPGTFSYSPPSGTVLGAGNGQTLSVTFTPKDTTDYTGASASTAIDVARATPTITWAAPAGIAYGTALSAAQLDATAGVPGTFTYSPTIGTVLGAGNGQTLSVSFTPDDTTDYASASAMETIEVFKVAVGSLILSPIPAQSVDVGQTLHLNLSPFASESGATALNLTYSLGSDAPAGASIDPTTGALTWPMGTNQQIGTYPITVRVVEDGSPQQVAATTFNVNVVDPGPAPTISGAIVSMKKGFSITLSFSQPVNPVAASNPDNYLLTQPAKSHTSKKESPPKPIRIGLSVSYNPTTNQVTLKGPKKLKAGRGLTLTVVGAGPNGIAKPDELHLAGSGGQPGTNYLASVTAKAINRISAVVGNTILARTAAQSASIHTHTEVAANPITDARAARAGSSPGRRPSR